ncbi:hypothetical protein BC828DRAFT_43588 [Blastocladiella britannica]|nr:hypothetical protein BC828DRAFT_43588 [Blastocladiella britannica]
MATTTSTTTPGAWPPSALSFSSVPSSSSAVSSALFTTLAPSLDMPDSVSPMTSIAPALPTPTITAAGSNGSSGEPRSSINVSFENQALDAVPLSLLDPYAPPVLRLSLAHNQLQSLDALIPLPPSLHPLRVLRLDHNRLAGLPEELFLATPLLESLSLNDNRLAALPRSLSLLPKLVHLFLDRNALTELPPAMHRLFPLLKTCAIAGNPLTFPPQHLTAPLARRSDDRNALAKVMKYLATASSCMNDEAAADASQAQTPEMGLSVPSMAHPRAPAPTPLFLIGGGRSMSTDHLTPSESRAGSMSRRHDQQSNGFAQTSRHVHESPAETAAAAAGVTDDAAVPDPALPPVSTFPGSVHDLAAGPPNNINNNNVTGTLAASTIAAATAAATAFGNDAQLASDTHHVLAAAAAAVRGLAVLLNDPEAPLELAPDAARVLLGAVALGTAVYHLAAAAVAIAPLLSGGGGVGAASGATPPFTGTIAGLSGRSTARSAGNSGVAGTVAAFSSATYARAAASPSSSSAAATAVAITVPSPVRAAIHAASAVAHAAAVAQRYARCSLPGSSHRSWSSAPQTWGLLLKAVRGVMQAARALLAAVARATRPVHDPLVAKFVVGVVWTCANECRRVAGVLASCGGGPLGAQEGDEPTKQLLHCQ